MRVLYLAAYRMLGIAKPARRRRAATGRGRGGYVLIKIYPTSVTFSTTEYPVFWGAML